MPQIKAVTVTNSFELYEALKPFMVDSKSTMRKLLIDGMNMVKKHLHYKDMQLNSAQSKLDDFMPQSRHIQPDTMYSWVDKMITERLNGIRNGLLIEWKLKDGNYQFDPYTGQINHDKCTN